MTVAESSSRQRQREARVGALLAIGCTLAVAWRVHEGIAGWSGVLLLLAYVAFLLVSPQLGAALVAVRRRGGIHHG